MKIFTILTLLMLSAGAAFSQNSGSTLNKKWDIMLEKAENYEHYKVIKKVELNEVWKSVQDSVSRLKAELKQERSQIKDQAEQITTLQKQLEEVKTQLDGVSEERDSMSFLGAQVDKYSYATTLWFIIFIVLGGCGVLFFLFQNSNRGTVQKIKDYDDLSKSFEEYKQSKIEMERKLKREMQTYINSIEELKRG